MRNWIQAATAGLLFSALPAISQVPRETPREARDFEDSASPKVNRHEQSPEELERRALEAMAAGRYKKARRLFEDLVALRPNEPRALFNLACALSRSGDLDEAASRLEASWRAGLRDPRLLLSDPDIEALRESPEGRALIEKLVDQEKQRARLQGVPQFFEAPTLGSFRVVTPDTLEAGRSYPLVVSLHGHGASAEFYAGMFESSGIPIEAIVMAPYGPYPVHLERGHGYSWYPPVWLYRQVLASENPVLQRSELELTESDVSRRYVLAAIEEVGRSYPVDPEQIFVLGHSEGGGLAYDLALSRPDIFRGLVVIAGRFRETDARRDQLAAAAGHLRALICHSPQDQAIGIEHSERARAAFREAGVENQLIRYAGGHGIPGELVRQIAKWIRKSTLEKPGG